jgi:hypothetical protein
MCTAQCHVHNFKNRVRIEYVPQDRRSCQIFASVVRIYDLIKQFAHILRKVSKEKANPCQYQDDTTANFHIMLLIVLYHTPPTWI